MLRIANCRVRRAPTSCGLPPRLLPAAEMALLCGSVGQAAALLEPLPLCPLAQVPDYHSCYLLPISVPESGPACAVPSCSDTSVPAV